MGCVRALACLSVLVWPLLVPFSGATAITEFSNGDLATDILLSLPELERVAGFDVPNPCIPLAASLNVTADPGHAPEAPALDLGDDGVPEWAFNGTGYGAFGAQTLFSDGSLGSSRPVDGPFSSGSGLILPKAASVRSATLALSGTPGDPAFASASGGPFDLAAGAETTFTDLGVPDDVSGINASVRLSGGKTTARDAECTAWSNFKIFGWQGVQYQSLAQTFTPTVACNLSNVEIQINSVIGSPGAIYIEVRNTDVSGSPAAAISSVMSIAQGGVTAPGWNAVSFSTPVALAANTKYAIVVYAKDASTSGINEYLWYGSSVDDPYAGGSLWIYAPDASAGGTPTQSALTDQAFRIFVERPLSTAEMGQVSVNGAGPSSSDGSGGFLYDFTDPAYPAGAWPFTVKNQNALNISSLACSASSWYRPEVADISLGFGGRTDFFREGPLDGTIDVDIGAFLSRELGTATPAPDGHGNAMCSLGLAVKASGAGTFRLSGLKIAYDCTFEVRGLEGALAAYIAGRQEGTVNVPVAVSASSEGRLVLSSLQVSVDSAPVLLAPIPALSIPEDGKNDSLLDISAYLADDEGCTYRCLVAEMANASNVEFTVERAILGARAVRKDWSGTVQLAVEAEDGRGQRTVSNSFILQVTPVNDAPVITSVPPSRAEIGQEYLYQLEAADVDGDTLSYSLPAAPDGMTVNASGLVSWRPWTTDLGTFNVTVAVSDGDLSASQPFSITTFTGNRPPAVPALADATGKAGTPFSLQIAASDPDGDELVFTLPEAPAGMFVNRTGVMVWANPVAGNHTVRARVSDGLAFAESTFVLRISAVPPPVITSAPPSTATQGKLLSYQLGAENPGQAGSLTYILVSGPEGMRVSNAGLVTWTPTGRQSGTFHVILRVRAGNESATQEFDLAVAAPAASTRTDNTPLVIAAIVIVAFVAAAAGVWVIKRKGKDGRPGSD